MAPRAWQWAQALRQVGRIVGTSCRQRSASRASVLAARAAWFHSQVPRAHLLAQPGAYVPRAAGARGMFVQTQSTPNPQSLMFFPGKVVLEEGQMQFDSAREAMQSPLAKRIFQIDGVRGVFLSNEFITITVTDENNWQEIKPQVYAAITDFYTSGENVLEDGASSSADTAVSPDDDEIVAMIKELIETRIKPAVAEDGGDIVFKNFDQDSGVVSIKMQGSCSGCPSSAVTLKSGIENMLMHYIPEVKAVEQVEDELDEISNEEFQKLEQKLN